MGRGAFQTQNSQEHVSYSPTKSKEYDTALQLQDNVLKTSSTGYMKRANGNNGQKTKLHNSRDDKILVSNAQSRDMTESLVSAASMAPPSPTILR